MSRLTRVNLIGTFSCGFLLAFACVLSLGDVFGSSAVQEARLVAIAVVNGLLAGTAAVEYERRKCMERQMRDERLTVANELRHQAQDLLGDLLSKAIKAPTSYYAHRISEALSHIESMYETAARRCWAEDVRQKKFSASSLAGTRLISPSR